MNAQQSREIARAAIPAQPSILIVEDELIVAKDLQRTLVELGYDVFAIASSAEAAVARAVERCPDLVMMDIRIKGPHDGIQTAAILKEQFPVAIIYLTAHADEAMIQRAKKTEPHGYLLKPVKAVELRTTVEIALYKHQLERARANAAELQTQKEAALVEMGRAVHESNQSFRMMVEAVKDYAIIMLDVDGRIASWNMGAERLKGYSEQDIIGQHFSVFYTADDVADRKPERNLETAARLGRTEDQGWRMRKDGTQFFADVVITAVHDSIGQLRGFAKVTQDVTARKQSDALLQQMIERFRVASSAAGLGFWDIDPVTHSLHWDDQMFQLFGRSRSEGKQPDVLMAESLHPDDSARSERELTDTISGIRPFDTEFRIVHPNGTVRHLQSAARLTSGADGATRMLGVSFDITERKLADEQFRMAIEAAPTGMLLMSRTGSIVLVNAAIENIFGYTRAELLGQRIEMLVPERFRGGHPGFRQGFFNAPKARGMGKGRDLYGLRKDGSEMPVEIGLTPFQISAGEFVLSSIVDLTERREAEEALLKAGALQRAIFNSANFSSIATDAKGVIQIFNVGAERMLGYTAAEVMNKIMPADFFDPQEVIARARALSAELETPITPGFEALVSEASRGIEEICELTYVREGGTRVPAVVSVTALRDAYDAIIGYLLIGTDNTARKQIEEERTRLNQRLRDQHFYTRSLIESNIDALMTTDPRGIITDVNRQTEALTGSTRDELIGAPFKNCFTDPRRAEAAINRVLNEGRVTNYELTARSRDGQLTVVSYNATTFHDRDRRLQGVFAAARDVTDLKRFERTLQQKNDELEEASRIKSEFLANMSHELRTPLNRIIGFSEVLHDGLMGPMTDQQRVSIGNIFSSGNHLLSLINDILDLSKIEAGKMILDLDSVDWSSLFEDSLSALQEMATARNVRLEMKPGMEDLGSNHADMRKVKQILYNLLSNAVKFTEEGGHVVLRAGIVPRTRVGQLSGSRKGRSFPLADSAFAEFLEIAVSDDGIGISPEGLERLFLPFSQIDSGLARKFEGTGLGLAMVKLLAELHGGTVAVESAVGDGSCFAAWLPLRESDEAPPAQAPLAPRIKSMLTGGTALVVEDDLEAAELIRVQLEAEGFTVLHATSAESALMLAMHQPLSLITLDIMMPTMDGWEFLTRLKQVPDLQRIPVVIISIAAERDKGFLLGASAVMQKPILRQELYESLVDLSLLPVLRGQTLKVLVVDDDPRAVELIALRIAGLANTVLRAHGGREAIDIARRELPSVVILDLMMPDVNGYDVVAALNERPDTARIPILVVTAKQITAEDRIRISRYVTTIMGTTEFGPERFTAEVRRAMSGRRLGV
jgi:PAS domain S-box-containing protein